MTKYVVFSLLLGSLFLHAGCPGTAALECSDHLIHHRFALAIG